MGYARHIGRVGALALALGVGAAVASTPAVFAQPSDVDSATSSTADPSSPSTSSSPDAVSPPRESSTEADADSDKRSDGTDSLTSSTQSPPADSDDTEDIADAVAADIAGPLPARGGQDDRSPTGETESTPVLGDVTSPDAQTVPPQAPAAATDVPATRSAHSSSGDRAAATTSPATPTDAVAAVGAERPTAGERLPSRTLSIVGVTATPSARSAVASASVELPEAASAAATSPVPPAGLYGLAAGAVTTASQFVAAVFNPLMGLNFPGAPAHTPLLWALLGWVRREIERTFFNDAPNVRNQEVGLALDDPADVSGPIAFLAGDQEHDALSYSVPERGAPGGPAHGTVTVDQATGTFVYDPDDDFANTGGTDSFTVTVSDAAGGFHLHGLLSLLTCDPQHTDTATVTISLPGVNRAPSATDDSATTAEDSPVSVDVLANDSDADSDPLSVTEFTNPAHGTVSRAGGVLTYTPDADFNGTDAFTYTISDGTLSATATVTVAVTSVNDTPVAASDTVTIAEDVLSVTGDVLANDTLGDGTQDQHVTTLSGGTAGSYGTITLSTGGGFTYTLDNTLDAVQQLAPGDTLTETYTYTLTDTDGETSTAAVTITITGTNDLPAAVADTATIAEDGAVVTGDVRANDTLGDGTPGQNHTTLAGNGIGAYGALAMTVDGAYNYTLDNTNPAVQQLAPGQSLSETYSYTLTDSNGDTSTATLTVTITGADDAPTATSDVGSVFEDGPALSGNVLNNDTLGDGTAAQHVTALPGSPIGSYGTLSLTSSGAFSYTLDNTNPAVQQLSAGQTVTDSFTYTLTDSDGDTAAATLVITITGSDDSPAALADTATIAEGATSVTGNVLGNDTLGDGTPAQHQVTLLGTGTHGMLTLTSDGTFTYTLDNADPAVQQLAPGQTLTETYDYTVVDVDGDAATATITITITGTDDAPTAVADTATIAEDAASITGNVLDNDTPGDGTSAHQQLSLDGSATGTYGTLSLTADGAFTYTLDNANPAVQQLAAGDTLTESYAYTIVDVDGDAATATLTITITGVNDTPTAVADIVTGSEDTPATIAPITLLGNDIDVDGDTLTITSVQDAVNGTVALVGGNVVFTPGANFNGAASFAYTVSDGHGGAATAKVTVNVAPVNDAPINVVPAGWTGFEDTPVHLPGIVITDVDAGTDTMTVTLTVPNGTLTATPGGGVTVSNSDPNSVTLKGTLTDINSYLAIGTTAPTFTPAADISGPQTLTITTTDGTSTDVDQALVGVLPINDAPVNTLPPSGWTTDEDTTVKLTGISVTDVDSGDGIIFFEIIASAGTLTATTAANVDVLQADTNRLTLRGKVADIAAFLADTTTAPTYTPAPNANGSATLTVKASDTGLTGNGGPENDIDTTTITINPINDAPVAGGDVRSTNEDTTATIAPVILLANDTDVEGDSLIITSVQDAVGGTATLFLGSVVFTPANDYNGPASFTYTVSDSHGGTATATVNVTVNPVNDAPVARPDTASIDEDTTGTLASSDLLGNDSDADGDAVVITSVQDAVNGTATLVGGSVVFSPFANHNGPASFTYTVSDTNGATATATVNITVNPVNDAPVANPDTALTSEDTPLTLTSNALLNNDTDIDGDALVITSVQNAQKGTVALSGSNVVFTPTANYNGGASFTYTVSDTHGGTATATVNVNVTAVNDPPVANPDTARTNEDTPVTLTSIDLVANDSDVDGNPLVVASVFSPVNGTVTLVNGNVVFTPSTDYSGPASFAYVVSDTRGGTSSAFVSVTVDPVNDAPVNILPSLWLTDEDTPLPLTGMSVADVDGASETIVVSLDVLTGTLTATPGNGITVTGSGSTALTLSGTVTDVNAYLADAATAPTYHPVADATGDVALTMTSSDSGNLKDTDSATIRVSAVNDAPVNTMPPLGWTTDEDAAVTLTGMSIADLDAGTGQVTVTLSVPTGQGSISASSGGGVIVTGSGSSILLTGRLSNINTYLANPTAAPTYTPAANATFPVTLTMTTNDNGNTGSSGARTDTTFATITVNPVNDAPVANGDVQTINEDTPTTVAPHILLANDIDIDIDGDTLTITSVQNAVGGTVALIGGTVLYHPNVDFNGAGSFTYTVSDSHGGTATATVNVTVNPINDAPVANNDVQTTNEDSPTTIAPIILLANDIDIDGDTLTITSVQNAVNGSVALTSGNVVFTPTVNFNGAASFTYTVSDSHGGTATATVNVTVNPVNDAPVAVNDAQSVNEDTALLLPQSALLANDVDVDGDTLTITLVQGAVNGSVALTGGNVVFTPTANYHGAASFAYTISDGHGATSIASVAINVNSVNDTPVANNDTQSVDEDTALTVAPNALLANDTDVDGDTLTITSVQSAVNGTVALTGGNVVFTPNANYNGAASFTYTISDGHGATSTGSVAVTVNPVNDAPVNILPPAWITNEDTAVKLLGMSVADVDAGTTTMSVKLSVPTGSLTAFSSGGVVVAGSGTSVTLTGTLAAINTYLAGATVAPTFTPAVNANGTVILTMTTSDATDTDVDTGTITVNPVNDAPVAVNDIKSVNEDTALTIAPSALLVNDVDIDGDTLTISSVQGPVNGTVALAGGNVVFTPTANFNGPASFTYTVSDGHGATSTATVAVAVNPVNDAPVNTTPTGWTTSENTSVRLTGMSIADVDAGTAPMTVTLATQTGSLAATSGNGVTVTGSGTGTLTLTGTVTNVNNLLALAGTAPIYTPVANTSGTVTVTMTTSDGFLVDNDSAIITVNPTTP